MLLGDSEAIWAAVTACNWLALSDASWVGVKATTCSFFIAAICAEVSFAICSRLRLSILSAEIEEMALVEIAAISAGVRADSCISDKDPIWAPLIFDICAELSPSIWLSSRAAI